MAEDTDGTLLQLKGLCEGRASTYGLLARMFRSEMDQQLIDELHDRRYPTSTGDEDVDEGYRLIATYLSNADERSVEELAVDFTRVFIGDGVDSYAAAFPFESVYTSERRLKMQDARDEVLAIYHAYGLDKSDTWDENEDHVAAELEFMQVMCERTARLLGTGDEAGAESLLRAQRNFLDDHLVAWVPMLANDMGRFAHTDMYRGLALLANGYLRQDAAFLVGVLMGSGE
jgi:TorA maturation chaperone TorD